MGQVEHHFTGLLLYIPFSQALKEEHREMKKLVLDHERRQEEEEYQGE